jgi:pilus assembly protein Flp/PilA
MKRMQTTLWNLYSGLQNLMLRDEGQDLIEYAMVFALIAFGATAAMHTLAGSVNTVFITIGTTLSNAVS